MNDSNMTASEKKAFFLDEDGINMAEEERKVVLRQAIVKLLNVLDDYEVGYILDEIKTFQEHFLVFHLIRSNITLRDHRTQTLGHAYKKRDEFKQKINNAQKRILKNIKLIETLENKPEIATSKTMSKEEQTAIYKHRYAIKKKIRTAQQRIKKDGRSLVFLNSPKRIEHVFLQTHAAPLLKSYKENLYFELTETCNTGQERAKEITKIYDYL